MRQSYRFVVQRLAYAQRYAHLPRHAKKVKRALKKLNTLAGRQVRDLSTSFEGNPHDGKTLATALDAVSHWIGRRYARVLVDKGWSSGRFSGDDARQEGPC